jgi:dimethylsulfoniopropionate demethylase
LWRSFFGGKVPPCGKPFLVTTTDGTQLVQITSGIFSPRLDCNVGLSMILRSHLDVGTSLVVHTPDGMARDAIVSVLPFGYD